ncbi:MAG: hypothetical protein ACOVKO_03570 [Elstera sp.]|jgi:hypothetical protein
MDYFFRFAFEIGAQTSHSEGNPINHLLNSGLNGPPLSIPAEEPVSISPDAVNRAGPAIAATSFNVTCTLRPSGVLPSAVGPSGSVGPPLGVVGVGQPASSTVLRLLSLLPAALFPFCAGVPAIGVGQPHSFACEPSIGCIFAPQFPAASSFADGVSQPAKAASAGTAPPAWFGPPLLPSVARGVFHEANCAAV